jgi:hypothetical protein
MNMDRSFIALYCVQLLSVAATCAPTTTVKPDPPKVTLASIDQEVSKGADLMTQAELQSELMSFVDRYAVVMGQADPQLPA